MSDPFTKLFWRLQNMQSEFSKLHTAVHRLRSFIDINIPNYDSNGKLLPQAPFYLCPGTVPDKNMSRRYNWSRSQAITHVKNERARLTEVFRSLTSAAWKIGFDIQGLKVVLDISTNFPEPTHCEVIANNGVFSVLDQQMEDVMLVYRYVKADMAGIPLSIAVKVPEVVEMDNRG